VVSRIAARSRSRVFEGAERLPHVVQVPEGGVELWSLLLRVGILWRGALTAVAKIQDEDESGEDREGDEGRCQGQYAANELPLL